MPYVAAFCDYEIEEGNYQQKSRMFQKLASLDLGKSII